MTADRKEILTGSEKGCLGLGHTLLYFLTDPDRNCPEILKSAINH